MKKPPIQLLRFYADTPIGQVNKYFGFPVNSYAHAIDLAAKYVQEKNFKIRAAYWQNEAGTNVRIDKTCDLEKHQNTITERNDLSNNLRITKLHYGL